MRPKILIVLIGISLIASIALLWITNRNAVDALDRSESARLEAVGSAIARLVALSMDESDHQLRSLGMNPILLDPKVPDAQRLEEMERIVHANQSLSEITLYAPDGLMSLTTTTQGHPVPQEKTHWFERARDTHTVVRSNPHRANGAPGLHVKVYIPVQLSGSEQPHVLTARLSFDRVSRQIEETDLGENGKMVLLDARGNILYDREAQKLLNHFDDQLSPEFWVEHPKGDYVDVSGADYLYSANTIPTDQTKEGEPWTLVSFLRR